MPKDSKGNFHPNIQRAMAADKRMGGKTMAPPMKSKPEPMDGIGGEGMDGSEHSELHPHGDGTFHTVVAGQETQHPHMGHALAHMAAHHTPEAKHSVIQHNYDGTHTSHHVDEGGEVQGPHDHENMEALKQHMDQFLGEEAHEGEDGGY